MNHIPFRRLLDVLREECEDCQDHAEDGYGKAKVSDVLQLTRMINGLTDKFLMNVENECKAGQVITRTLGVTLVVAEGSASFK